MDNSIFHGLYWAIAPDALERISAGLAVSPPRSAREQSSSYGSTTVIPVQGALTASSTLMSLLTGATTYAEIRENVAQAVASGARQIVLDIDSPGGEICGLGETAEVIAQAAKSVPVIAYARGSAQSAAYWLASQASTIVAAPTAIIGSIGVMATVVDSSGAAEKAGVRVVQLRSRQSPLKNQDPSSDDGRAAFEDKLSAIADVFIAAVARGRGVATDVVLRDFGRGESFVGADALRAGMVDRVEYFSINGREDNHMSIKAQEDCAVCASLFGLIGASDQAQAIGRITAMQSAVKDATELHAQLSAFKAERDKFEVEQLLAGRAPAQREQLRQLASAHGLSALRACLEIMPTAPVAAMQPRGDEPEIKKAEAAAGLGASPALTKSQLSILRNLNVSPDAFAATATASRIRAYGSEEIE